METIAARLERIREQSKAAALAAQRDPLEVRLIAVSKGQSSAAVREAYAAGQRDFGENYVQELSKKAEELADCAALSWHMIGHLQRNKAKLVVRHAACVHSVDSVELALELDKRALTPLPILVEVSIAGESQKSGVLPAALGEVLSAIEAAPKLELRGLMCVPPLAGDAEGSRQFFSALRRLRDEHGGRARLPELSMGMTADFAVAIAEGATLIRVGTAIFGPRSARESEG